MNDKEKIQEMWLEYNRVVAENPDKLVVLVSLPHDPENPDPDDPRGKMAVFSAPDLNDLQEIQKRPDWKIMCFSWHGQNFHVKDNKVTLLKGLPFHH